MTNPTEEWTGTIDGFNVSINKVHVETMGSWLCGYVNLPSGHPWLDMGYEVDCDIHGGITYNRDGKVGFDCGHFGDSIEVHDMEYVKCELESLASQAKKAIQ